MVTAFLDTYKGYIIERLLRFIHNEERWPDSVVGVDYQLIIIESSSLLSEHLEMVLVSQRGTEYFRNTDRIVTSRGFCQRDVVLGHLAPLPDYDFVQKHRFQWGCAVVMRIVVRPNRKRISCIQRAYNNSTYFDDVEDVYIPFPNL
jgi:hypothetical protein